MSRTGSARMSSAVVGLGTALGRDDPAYRHRCSAWRRPEYPHLGAGDDHALAEVPSELLTARPGDLDCTGRSVGTATTVDKDGWPCHDWRTSAFARRRRTCRRPSTGRTAAPTTRPAMAPGRKSGCDAGPGRRATWTVWPVPAPRAMPQESNVVHVGEELSTPTSSWPYVKHLRLVSTHALTAGPA